MSPFLQCSSTGEDINIRLRQPQENNNREFFVAHRIFLSSNKVAVKQYNFSIADFSFPRLGK